MPEIKSSFLGGKMNKDLDERLLPKGQYRNAENIEISTAESANVGAAKSILGNKRLEFLISNDFTCVGSLADEKTNKLYWFVTTYLEDGIFEYDTINDVVLPVLLDLNASNSNAVLRFGTSPITGINVIDNLLLWTDNLTNPKKINIDECKKGTSINGDGSWNHTQLSFPNGSFDGVTLENIAPTPFEVHDGVNFLEKRYPKGRYFFFQEKQISRALGFPDGIPDSSSHYLRQYRNGVLLRRVRCKLWTNSTDLGGGSSNGTHGRIAASDPAFTPFEQNQNYVTVPDFHQGDILFGDNVTVDIKEKHITIIRPKPFLAPSTKINHKRGLDSRLGIPNLFETVFPRFSYRYKYRDGEFSSFAPFTNAVFNPIYPKDLNNSSETNVFHTKDNIYGITDPSNKAMKNSINSIELSGFINAKTPEDVIEVDVLYKQENSSVVYSIATIKHNDPEWHLPANDEGYNLGYSNDHPAFKAAGGYTKGKYIVNTENIYAALPTNQLLRPWDNVPRRAKAQEVTGNRVVYGNYLQNYNLGEHRTKIKVNYSDRSSNIGSFNTQALPSIKSQRNYQLGVVYCDKYGRETPVFTSTTAAVTVPWADPNGLKNASRSLQLNANVAANFPEWIDSIKFYIKETSNEYYNLVMDRAWVSQSTDDLDNSEGHLWISFPSSDRNKITEGKFIVLKKKIGLEEGQIAVENKFKVINISNEAPDAIKYELINQGIITAASDIESIFNNADSRMDVPNNNNIYLDASGWKTSGFKGVPLEHGETPVDSALDVSNIYISWYRIISGSRVASKKYKVAGGRLDSSGYMLKLKNEISSIDADIAHFNGDSSEASQPTNMNSDLVVELQRKELKTGEDFSGSFFVKISKNQVSDIIEQTNVTSVLDNHQVNAKTPCWWWRDDIAVDNNVRAYQSTYGITNYNGYDSGAHSGGNSIQSADNNVLGDVGITNDTLDTSDYAEIWSGIYDNYVVNNVGTFFLDGMYMASGQSDASNYAKYNCVTWSGAHKDKNKSTYHIKGLSAWSYPPLKTWLGDYEDSTALIENLETDTPLLLNNMLISTSPALPENASWLDNKVDGWVGHSQRVERNFGEAPSVLRKGTSHVNGLEGIVTSGTDHADNGRRWLSGISGNPTEYGVGVDTKTYSDNGETGRHFMHLSFFAPGDDLHDGNVTIDDGSDGNSFTLFEGGAVGRRLQGIWGGGHFTGDNLNDTIGNGTTDETRHQHLCLEGNYDSNGDFLSAAPGPGVGFGYDLKYKELHERQWDPTFPSDPGNKIRDFIRNIHAGSQFKFNPYLEDLTNANETIYTIKSVDVKKIYNHTSWRNTFNRWEEIDGYTAEAEDKKFWSVERAAMDWLQYIGSDGKKIYSAEWAAASNLMSDKIQDFGKSHNRRLCYIIELDKDPTKNGNFNPIDTGVALGRMTADQTNNEYHNIEFLDKIKSVAGINDLNKYPAIWETDPAKQQVDLDIYFEASSNIPVRLNNNTNEIFAPIGCRVELLNSPVAGLSYLTEWNNNIATLTPGFAVFDSVNEINYSGVSFKFIKEDGSYVIAKAGANQLTGAISTDPPKTLFTFDENIGENIRVGLNWNNCFSFGNGLESNRIGDDFNEMFLVNGVKASTTTQITYQEERRSTGLIYSGLYNSNSGVNDLNQFIMAEKITKDLNPTFGSIQKLFQRRISLVAFCEDRVISITSNKDAIYNADGNPQLIASDSVLGDANPFEGNYGISKNPESFASESYRAYFTDKNKGAVVRLSKDGLTPISTGGMHDWFRDNLKGYTALIGTYDAYKEDYNLTLSHKFSENIIFNSYLESGGIASTSEMGQIANELQNPSIFSGMSLQYPYEIDNILTDNNYTWGNINEELISTVLVTNHAVIPEGSLQAYVPYLAPVDYVEEVIGVEAVLAVTEVIGVEYVEAVAEVVGVEYQAAVEYVEYVEAVAEVTAEDEVLAQDAIAFSAGVVGVDYSAPEFAIDPDASGNGFIYNGPFIAGWNETTGDIFGVNRVDYSDSLKPSTIVRKWGANVYDEDQTNFQGSGANNSNLWYDYGQPGAVAHTYAQIYGVIGWRYAGKALGKITQDATGSNQGTQGAILFNRTYPNNTRYVEFKDLGQPPNNGQGLLDLYNYQAGQLDNENSAMFAGDEIEIKVILKISITSTFTSGNNTSYPNLAHNHVIPQIELHDGSGGIISPDKIMSTSVIVQSPTLNQNLYNPVYYAYTPFITETAYNTSGINADIDLGFVSSAQVVFPQTQYTTTSTGQSDSTPVAVYTLKFRVKFKDPAQSYTSASNSYVDSKVVDDLRIRVCNVMPLSTLPIYNGVSNDYQGSGPSPLRGRAKFWVHELVATKTLGIIKPDVEFVQFVEEQQAQDAQAYVAAVEYQPAIDEVLEVLASDEVEFVQAQEAIQGVDAVLAVAPVDAVDFVQAVLGVDEVLEIAEVAAVPPYEVEAWTQVTHQGLNNWLINTSGGADSYVSATTINNFGGDYPAVSASGFAQNSDPAISGGSIINYVTPGVEPTSGSPFGTSPYAGIGYGNGTSNSGTIIEHDNSYVLIDTVNYTGNWNAQSFSIYQDISATSLVVNEWYLIDVEFDESHNASTGNNSNGNGLVEVDGVVDRSGTLGTEISPQGVGFYSGVNAHTNCGLVPTVRTEYGNTDGSGDNKLVLRGIFKFHSNSWRETSGSATNYLRLLFTDFTNTAKITKIITRSLETTTTTGTANHWYHFSDDQAHSFSPKAMYWQSNGSAATAKTLCFEEGVGGTENVSVGLGASFWAQDLPFGGAMATSVVGWKFKFKITNNPRTNTFLGALNAYINTEVSIDNSSDGGVTAKSLGILVKDIDAVGDYEIDFNFETSDSNWTINAPAGASTTLEVYPNPTSVEAENKLVFYTQNNTQTICGIKDTVIGDKTLVLLGGSIGSWDWRGFDQTQDNFITWDNVVDINTGTSQNRIEFTNCPFVDGDNREIVSASQYVDTVINRYEHWTVSIDHGIYAGDLSVYYFNSKGFGFRIFGINSSNQGTLVTNVVVGALSWESINPADEDLLPEMKNAFVIRPQSNSAPVSGWVDNVTMTRNFALETTSNGNPIYTSKTISFNEGAN